MQTVTDNRADGVTTYNYDATSQVSSFAYPNGVTHSFGYDLRDRTTSLSLGSIANYVQSFSNSGHKTGVMELSGRAPAYQYDQVWRLTQEAITGDPVSANNGVLTHMLDPVGNRTSLTSTLAALPNQSFTYDPDDRLQSDTYDANGNTVSSGGVNYSYEFEDRLVSTSNGVTIVYDGDGNRASETAAGITTKYLVDDLTPTHYAQVAEETVNGVVTAQFTYGLMRISQNRDGTASYYGFDPGGSVRQLLSPAGAVTDTYAYDGFGNTVTQAGSTTNEFLYRGEQWDSALQMYYLRARYYVPRTGRFLTSDKFEPGDIATCDCPMTSPAGHQLSIHNLFGYAASDPVGLRDPRGAEEEEEGLLSQIQNGVKKFYASSVGLTLYSLCRGYTLFRLVGSIATWSSFGSLGLSVDIGCGVITFGPYLLNVSTPNVVAVIQWFITLAEGELPANLLDL